MFLKRFSALILFIFTGYQLTSQGLTSFFTTIGAEGDEVGYSVKAGKDGSYFIAGASSSYGTHGSMDGYVVKTNAVGFPNWTRFLGGGAAEAFYAVAFAPDSGVIAVGYTNSFGSGGYDIYLVRLDKNGNTLWTRTWGGAQWDFGNDIVVTPDSSIMVVGFTDSFGAGEADAVLLKYKLDGSFVWQKIFGGNNYDDFRSIIVTNDSMLAIVGLTESGLDEEGDGWFLKVDLNGDTVFTKSIGGPYADRANDIVQKPSSEFVIAGARTYSADAYSRSYMYSFDNNGVFMWENNYYHSQEDEEYVSLANSKHLLSHTGFLKNIPVPDLSFQSNLFVASPGGWPYIVNSFGGEQDDFCYSIDATNDGGFVIVGRTKSFNSQGDDIFLMMFDSTISNYKNTVDVNLVSATPSRARCYFTTKDELVIDDISNETEVTVINYSGGILKTQMLEPGKNHISFTGYSSGLFILRFKTSDGLIYCSRLVK